MQVEIEPHSKVYDKNNRLKSEKMNKKYLKIAAILLFIGVITTGCGSRRNQLPYQAGRVEEAVIFGSPAYRSDDTHWRANGNAISSQLSMAQRIATQNARTAIAQQVEAHMRIVGENAARQFFIGTDTEDGQIFNERVTSTTSQTLNDVRIIGERQFRLPDGRVQFYVALEMSKDAVIRAISNSVAADDRLRLQFDAYQFRQIFEEEMRNFENR